MLNKNPMGLADFASAAVHTGLSAPCMGRIGEPEEPTIESAIKRLTYIYERTRDEMFTLQSLRSRLREQINGPVPEAANKEQERPCPCGLIMLIEAISNNSHEIESTINDIGRMMIGGSKP